MAPGLSDEGAAANGESFADTGEEVTSFAEYLPDILMETAARSEQEDEEDEDTVFRPHLTGPAAAAISRSNCVPTDHRPRRTPWIVRYMGAHKKYIKKPQRRQELPKGKVIDGTDEQYVLTYAMRLGINRSVDYARHALPDSFEAATAEKLVTHFPPSGSDVTPKHDLRHNFTVTDFAPCVFSKIRHLMGVSDDMYKRSLCDGRLGFIKFIANSRSGQFFFYSNDHVFMIKTLRVDEKQFLLKLLPDYYAHLVAHSNDAARAFQAAGTGANGASSRDSDAAWAAEAIARSELGLGSTPEQQQQHQQQQQRPQSSSSSTTGPQARGGSHPNRPPSDRIKFGSGRREISRQVTGLGGYAAAAPELDNSTTRARPSVDADFDVLSDEDLDVPNNNDSMLTRFYGLHCTKLRHLKRKVYFVVMASIYGGISYEQMTVQFDLKGSSYKRAAEKGDNVLKDNDARGANLKIAVGRDRAKVLLEAAASDAHFLARNGVMDYSLLIGIYHLPVPAVPSPTAAGDDRPLIFGGSGSAAGDPPGSHPAGGAPPRTDSELGPVDWGARAASTADPENATDTSAVVRAGRTMSAGSNEDQQTVACYFMGIIDILQVYNLRKHIETDFNLLNKGPRKYRECSCVPPYHYRDRFIEFLKTIIV